MNIFRNYANYYDLLYKDKNYKAEVKYIDKLIKKYTKRNKSLLDLGCGTGKYAELFYNKGYIVQGVDLSKEMIQIAKNTMKQKGNMLNFRQADITDLKLNAKYDVVVSLFHVMSYQRSNDDLFNSFKTAFKHLKRQGIFIFDFWYGPAVLTNLPERRFKRVEDERFKVIRVAKPFLRYKENIVDVNYDIFIKDKKNRAKAEEKEIHKMRYFFDPELELICEKIGFKIENKFEWMSIKNPGINSWSVVWIVRRM